MKANQDTFAQLYLITYLSLRKKFVEDANRGIGDPT